MADLKDILNEDDDLKNEDLLRYLQGELPKDGQYQVEKQMNDSDFVNDAIEGLQQVRNKKSIETYVEELNRNLRKQVTTRKHRKYKRKLKDNSWIVITVVIVLMLMVLAWAVISFYNKNPVPSEPPNTGQPAQ
ncbi:MAG TPA: hypothetical protein VF145_01480 [Chitinophagaceae bacterium]